jgi:ParB family chromosome partitioning protein
MESMERRVMQLGTEEIRPNPRQPRRTFDEAGLQELADSIRAHGILQPLTVRQTDAGWELVAGERRLRAARIAGLAAVPCLETAVDDHDAALLALVENLQRQDLHYLEEAAAIAAFLQETGETQEAAAAKLGRSPSAVANKLRLLRLSPACREVLVREGLSERHARCLLRLEDEGERLSAARHIAANHLSVAQAEAYVERRLAALQSTPPTGRRTYIIKDVRLFLNSVDRGLRLIRDAGVDAAAERAETEDSILLTIRIPKQRRQPPAKEACGR